MEQIRDKAVESDNQVGIDTLYTMDRLAARAVRARLDHSEDLEPDVKRSECMESIVVCCNCSRNDEGTGQGVSNLAISKYFAFAG
jgi:hypothetical protein